MAIDSTEKQGWRSVKLGEISEVITKGTTPKASSEKRFTETGINYLKAEVISFDGAIDTSKFVFVSQQTHDKLKRSHLQAGDILFSMAGVFIGKTAVVPREILPANCNQAVGFIRLKSDEALPRFIDFYIRNPSYNYFVNNLVSQSAQPNLPLGEIRKLPILLPPMPEQLAISHVLGTLDDKIELNCRMNVTLEGMAQALFKSWFVDFDPVIDNALAAGNPIPAELADRAEVRRAALADGTANREAAKPFPAAFQQTEELGWIPNGWDESVLADFGSITTGRTPPKAVTNAYGAGRMFLTPTDYDGGLLTIETTRRLSDDGEKSIAKARIPQGSIGVSCIGSQMGRTTLITEEAFTNQQINSISPHDEMHRYYILMNLRSRRDEIFAIGSSGSTMPIVNKGTFSRLPFLSPDEETLRRYDAEVSIVVNKMIIGAHQNKTLEKLRDTLLPKLISGELRIPEAEKLAEEALA